jgi:hypothetical protein
VPLLLLEAAPPLPLELLLAELLEVAALVCASSPHAAASVALSANVAIRPHSEDPLMA